MSTIVTRAGKGSPLSHAEVDQNWLNLNTDKLEVGATFNAAVAATPAVTANTAKVTNATHTGDATGATALTLATVNANVGAFGSATQVATFTVDGKGRTTAAGNTTISIPMTAISDSTAAGRAVLGAASATAQTALLDVFTSGAKGLVPASGGGTTNFLRADGTFAAPGGGGGSPGGSSGEVQYNNGGAFAGAADVEIEGGQLRLPYAATPATPAAGGLKLYGTGFGAGAPAFLLPSGKVRLVQSDLGDFNVNRFTPVANSNSLVLETSFGLAAIGTATPSLPVITNLHTMLQRVDFLVTVAATTAIAGWRATNGGSRFFRVGKDANAPGGFLCRQLWGPATGVATTTNRCFVGVSDMNAAPTDVEPSTRLNIAGMGWDAADANIQFMHNDGAGAATKIDLGASFPVPTTDRSQVYELQLYSPNSLTQSISYRAIRYNTTDKTIAAETSGTVTTDMPAVSVLLNAAGAFSVGGTSSVIGIALMGILTAREY